MDGCLYNIKHTHCFSVVVNFPMHSTILFEDLSLSIFLREQVIMNKNITKNKRLCES